jgi:L-fuconolactonase
VQIFDGQIHLWLPDTPEHPWAPGVENYMGDSYLIEDALALMDREGVEGAVIVTPSWLGIDNSYGLEAARLHPNRFAVMGRFDYRPDGMEDRLHRWRDQPGMLGIRATVIDPLSVAMFTDPDKGWFWELCGDLGIPLMVYPRQYLPRIADLAARAPGLRIIIDHCARIARGPMDEAAWTDIDVLLALARHENVAVKVSSLPSFSSQPYPFPNLHPPLRAIYDSFGPDRMIWGSDVTRLYCEYSENIRLFAEALDFLSDEDRQKILAHNLTRWCDARFRRAG